MDMFLIIPNLLHALATTLDKYLLGVIVYVWTSFLTRKTVGIDTEIVFAMLLGSKTTGYLIFWRLC